MTLDTIDYDANFAALSEMARTEGTSTTVSHYVQNVHDVKPLPEGIKDPWQYLESKGLEAKYSQRSWEYDWEPLKAV